MLGLCKIHVKILINSMEPFSLLVFLPLYFKGKICVYKPVEQVVTSQSGFSAFQICRVALGKLVLVISLCRYN